MYRRDLVKILILTAATTGTGVFSHNIYGSDSESIQKKWLKFRLDLSPTIAEIGNTYLLENKSENKKTITNYFQEIFGDSTDFAINNMSINLKNQIDEDYSMFKTFETSGWVVSETEAKLAAFISLEQ